MTRRWAVLAALLLALAGLPAPGLAQDGGGGSPALYPDGDPYSSPADQREQQVQRERREQRERLFREAEQRRARAERERTQSEIERVRRRNAARDRNRVDEARESGLFNWPTR